jgi:hypothetical protein
MDSAPAEGDPDLDTELQTQTAVAKAGLQTAKNRQESGNDRAAMLKMLDQFNSEIIVPWRAQRAKEAKAADDAKWADFKARVASLKKTKKAADAKRKAADAMARQRAYDAAVEGDQLADQRKQERIAAADHNFYASVRRQLEGRDDKEIGEVSASAGEPFASQVRTERAAQEKLSLQPPPKNKVKWPSAYQDLGSDYASAGRKLRGEDALPRNHEEKLLAEHKLARRKLEGR